MIRGINVTQVAVSTPFDNSTDGWIANNVQAAIEEAPFHLVGANHAQTGTATLTTTDAILAGVTVTAGATNTTYFVTFTGDVISATSGSAISVSIYLAGTQIGQSLKKTIPFSGGTLTSGNARGSLATTYIVTTTGASQVIDIRASSSSAGATVQNGVMSWIRLT